MAYIPYPTSSSQIVKYKRSITGNEMLSSSYMKYKRAVHTGEKVIVIGGGGSERPATGQIFPRGK
jgi:hypothetical protein